MEAPWPFLDNSTPHSLSAQRVQGEEEEEGREEEGALCHCYSRTHAAAS